MTLAVTEDSTTIPNDSAAHWRRMSSIAKNTPASGALNVAAIPPAAPQATSSLIRRSSSFTSCPSDGPEGGADLHDRSFPADRSAAADAQRRGDRLDHRDLGADAAAVAGDRDHHLGHAVAAGLAGEAVDQRPVEDAGDDRGEQDEPVTQRRQVRVGGVTVAGVVLEAGEHPGQALDHVPEHHRTEPGAHPDQHREAQQPDSL